MAGQPQHSIRLRSALALLAVMAYPVFADTALAVGVELSWEYATEEPGAEALGFNVYRGVGDAECSLAGELPLLVGSTPRKTLGYADQIAGVEAGTICYEASAFNAVGESGHSNRATAQAESVIPSAPQGVSVEILIE